MDSSRVSSHPLEIGWSERVVLSVNYGYSRSANQGILIDLSSAQYLNQFFGHGYNLKDLSALHSIKYILYISIFLVLN